MLTDDSLYQVCADLLVCIEGALGGATPQRSCVVVGDIVWDNCCADGGQLAVSVDPAGIFPTVRFPIPDIESSPCGAAQLGVPLLASLLRCAPVSNQSGKPPSCEALDASAQRAYADALAIRRGIRCCWPTSEVVVGRTRFIVQGNCVGVESALTVSLIDPCGDCQ